jgi:hypothetical protein
MYFRFNYVTVFSCIFVTIIVSVNEMDVFPLTDISVTVIVNGKNTGPSVQTGDFNSTETDRRGNSGSRYFCVAHAYHTGFPEPCIRWDASPNSYLSAQLKRLFSTSN